MNDCSDMEPKIIGIDMIANYVLENFDKTFVETYALEPLEFNPKGSRGQFYQ